MDLSRGKKLKNTAERREKGPGERRLDLELQAQRKELAAGRQ